MKQVGLRRYATYCNGPGRPVLALTPAQGRLDLLLDIDIGFGSDAPNDILIEVDGKLITLGQIRRALAHTSVEYLSEEPVP